MHVIYVNYNLVNLQCMNFGLRRRQLPRVKNSFLYLFCVFSQEMHSARSNPAQSSKLTWNAPLKLRTEKMYAPRRRDEPGN
jgi:hypothetical protein